jgi:hypothetical protein
MGGSILVQSAMGPQAVVIGGILAKDSAQVGLSKHRLVVDARRIVPISLSAQPFHGDPGAIGLSVCPWRVADA